MSRGVRKKFFTKNPANILLVKVVLHMHDDKSVRERLKQFRTSTIPGVGDTYAKAMSQAHFARCVDYQTPYINMIEAGNRNISDSFLDKVNQNTLINMDWLLTGKGFPYRYHPKAVDKLVAGILSVDKVCQHILGMGSRSQEEGVPPKHALSMKDFESSDLPADGDTAEKCLELVKSLLGLYEHLPVILDALKKLSLMILGDTSYMCYLNSQSYAAGKSYMSYTREIDDVRKRLDTYRWLLYKNSDILNAINSPDELFNLDERIVATVKKLSIDDKLKFLNSSSCED